MRKHPQRQRESASAKDTERAPSLLTNILRTPSGARGRLGEGTLPFASHCKDRTHRWKTPRKMRREAQRRAPRGAAGLAAQIVVRTRFGRRRRRSVSHWPIGIARLSFPQALLVRRVMSCRRCAEIPPPAILDVCCRRCGVSMGAAQWIPHRPRQSELA